MEQNVGMATAMLLIQSAPPTMNARQNKNALLANAFCTRFQIVPMFSVYLISIVPLENVTIKIPAIILTALMVAMKENAYQIPA